MNAAPLLRRLVEREDGLDRTRRHTGAAVDALVGMNIKHFGRRELRFVLPGMNAVDRTDVHARRVLGADARFADDIRHVRLRQASFILAREAVRVPVIVRQVTLRMLPASSSSPLSNRRATVPGRSRPSVANCDRPNRRTTTLERRRRAPHDAGSASLEVVDSRPQAFGLTHGFGGHVLDRWRSCSARSSVKIARNPKRGYRTRDDYNWTCFPSEPRMRPRAWARMSRSPSGSASRCLSRRRRARRRCPRADLRSPAAVSRSATDVAAVGDAPGRRSGSSTTPTTSTTRCGCCASICRPPCGRPSRRVVLGEVRSENGDHPQPYALYVRLRPWTIARSTSRSAAFRRPSARSARRTYSATTIRSSAIRSPTST